jgi:hypothetical protein
MTQWGVWEVNDAGSYPGHTAIRLYWREQDAVRYWKKHHSNERRLIVREVRL